MTVQNSITRNIAKAAKLVKFPQAAARVFSCGSRTVSAATLGMCLVCAASCLAFCVAPAFSLAQDAKSTKSSAGSQKPAFETVSLRGRVVWMSEALLRRHGIREVPEAAEKTLALETKEGELIPLVEDTRGRAFRSDTRLREMDVELLVRRFSGAPAVQIIRVFELAKDGKYELDYWCDICAIVMVELKDCECCQGPTELRHRKVSNTPK